METVIYEQISLHFQNGPSDKVYHLAVTESGDTYECVFAYGRRGSTLKYGSKTKGPTTLSVASKMYNKYLAEKLNEDYKEARGVSGDNVFGHPFHPQAKYAPAGTSSTIPATPPKTVSIVAPKPTGAWLLPQLLNPVTEEQAMQLLSNPEFGMQEKKNGTRLIIKATDGVVKGINRKGKETPVAYEIVESVLSLGKNCVLDGEAIGPVLHVFDCLGYDTTDIRMIPFRDRYERLIALIGFPSEEGRDCLSGLKIVPLAKTGNEMRSLWERVKANNGEGFVFKKLSAPYVAGRPNSGGDQLKFKLWSDCSAVVIGINNQRSVQVGIIENGQIVPVGNVTIPANYDIPNINDVVSIRYLYAYRGGSLYQPIYEGPRTDQDIADCTIEQLVYFEQEEIAQAA